MESKTPSVNERAQSAPISGEKSERTEDFRQSQSLAAILSTRRFTQGITVPSLVPDVVADDDNDSEPAEDTQDAKALMGLRCCSRRTYVVSSSFNNPIFQTRFAVVILVINLIGYIPSLIILPMCMFVPPFREWLLLDDAGWVVLGCVWSLIGYIIVLYVSGGAKKEPLNVIALIVKMSCFTVFVCTLSPITEREYIKMAVEKDVRFIEASFNPDTAMSNEAGPLFIEYISGDHSVAYWPFLAVILVAFSDFSTIVLIFVSKTILSSYKIQMIQYGVVISCFAVSMHAVLLKSLGNGPPSWDLLQIYSGFILGGVIGAQAPRHFTRLFTGKLGPIQDNDFYYAALMYGF